MRLKGKNKIQHEKEDEMYLMLWREWIEAKIVVKSRDSMSSRLVTVLV